MSFKTRNLYYLRISEHSVLPVYVYLDERHLDWMSDQVLQHVLSDLRPRVLPKLLGETGILANPSSAKKATVDTHRGDSYQFCYFLRRTEPHSVAIKTRNYVAKTSQNRSNVSTSAAIISNPARRSQRKRKQRSSSDLAGSPAPRSSKKHKNDEVLMIDDSEGSQDESNAGQAQGDTDMDGTSDLEDDTFNPPIEEEEEEKPKPVLQLNYKGFGIYGQCLCIVVEPWPPIRSTTRMVPELGGISSLKSNQQPAAQSVPTISTRAKTPLFLEDGDETVHHDARVQPVVNAWDDSEMQDDSDDDIEFGGMMAFSQALNMAGDSRPGALEDDNEMEGTVLFSDADEARQL